jgi:hypothetical protein
VPQEHLERVASALFDAGRAHRRLLAVQFPLSGTGTFFGEEGTNPAVGQSGKLEQAAEVRLETVIPIARVGEILAAPAALAPYEEPAFDLVQLAAAPEKVGQGRIGSLPNVERAELFARIRKELDLAHLLIAGPAERDRRAGGVLRGIVRRIPRRRDALRGRAVPHRRAAAS